MRVQRPERQTLRNSVHGDQNLMTEWHCFATVPIEGKAVKTVFLCDYLNAEGLRREINEGLNVVENHRGRRNIRIEVEVYSKLAITEAQNEYNEVINKSPI